MTWRRWLAQLVGKPPEPLTGAPAVRRQKRYTGEAGYVYEYYFEGYRVAKRGGQMGTEFIFDVAADRRSSFPVAVFLADDAVHAWERQHGRELNYTERYAVVKLALFRAFDEREGPKQMRRQVRVGAAEVESLLGVLGID